MKEVVLPDRDSTEIYRISYNTGVSLQRTLTKNFSFRSGFFFNNRGIKLRKIPVCRPGPPPNCKTGWIGRLNNVDTVESELIHGYLSIPAIIQYDFHLGKYKVGAFVGLSFDYLLYVKVHNTEYALGNVSLTYNVYGKPYYINNITCSAIKKRDERLCIYTEYQ